MGRPYTYKVSDLQEYYKKVKKRGEGEIMQDVFVRDDVFPWIDHLSRWVKERAEFKLHKAGGAGFEVARLPERLSTAMTDRVSAILQKPIKMRYSFLRLSTLDIDVTMRIHTDTGMRADYACLVYLSDAPEDRAFDELYGTAFWRHEKYGKSWTLPNEKAHFINIDKKEHDRLITDDSQDPSKWKMDSFVSVKKNRMLIYPTSIFHSRYPWKGWGKDQTDGRTIWMMFFDKEKSNE